MIALNNLPMADKITLHELEMDTVIGVYEFERHITQKLRVTLHFTLDAHKLAQEDTLLPDSIDYAQLSEFMVEFARKSTFFLLETFAQKLGEALFLNYPLKAIELEVTKPGALKKAKGVTITLCRTSPVI